MESEVHLNLIRCYISGGRITKASKQANCTAILESIGEIRVLLRIFTVFLFNTKESHKAISILDFDLHYSSFLMIHKHGKQNFLTIISYQFEENRRKSTNSPSLSFIETKFFRHEF